MHVGVIWGCLGQIFYCLAANFYWIYYYVRHSFTFISKILFVFNNNKYFVTLRNYVPIKNNRRRLNNR